MSNLDAWLRSILWDSKLPTLGPGKPIHGAEDRKLEIHRLKARFPLSNGNTKIVQGVREVFEILDCPKSDESAPGASKGKVVLIGRNLTGVSFEESFVNTMNS